MMQLFFWFLNRAKPQRRGQFFALTALIVASGLVELAALGGLALFITSLTSPDEVMRSSYLTMVDGLLPIDILSDTRTFYLYLGLATLAFIVAKNILSACHTYAIARFDGALNVDYGCKVLRGILELPYGWGAKQNSSDLMSVLGWRLYVGSLMTHALSLLCDVVVSLLLFSSLFILQPVATLVVMAVLGLIGGGTYLLVKTRILSLALRIRDLVLDINKVSMKSVQGLKDVKLFRNIGESVEYFKARQTDFVQRIAVQRVLERATVWTLETVGFGGLVVGALVMLWTDKTSSANMMGTLSLLAVSAWRVLPAMYRCAAIFGYVQGYTPFLLKLQDMVNRIDEHERKYRDVKPVELPLFSKEIRLEDILFRYDGAEELALSGVDLSVPRGSLVGIIGHSGAGKSTLADILTGLVTPSGGVVRVDGAVLDRGSVHSWRSQVGFVPQSPYLFDGSIAENVSFTVDENNIDFDKVSECCRLAGLDEYLSGQAQGVNSVIGERGSQLSGGQAQRVAIARALYNDPQVLIFDEATSSLDEKTERFIRETIIKLRASRTIFIIAHRLKTVEDCDFIVWLEQGRVVEVGAPERILPQYGQKQPAAQR